SARRSFFRSRWFCVVKKDAASFRISPHSLKRPPPLKAPEQKAEHVEFKNWVSTFPTLLLRQIERIHRPRRGTSPATCSECSRAARATCWRDGTAVLVSRSLLHGRAEQRRQQAGYRLRRCRPLSERRGRQRAPAGLADWRGRFGTRRNLGRCG